MTALKQPFKTFPYRGERVVSCYKF